jgi:hypothetical protein
MRRSRSAPVVLLAVALLAVAALRDLTRLGDALPWKQLYDFSDFYCAGDALDRAADPYRYEPLHRCEHSVNHSDAYRRDPGRVVPAPLPPYDFPPLMFLARLDFSQARFVDALAIVLSVAAAIWGLCLVRVPPAVAAFALALPAGYVLLAAGQIVPFALVALVFCGVALARERFALAGVLAALSLIEPHLGLPVCAALFVWSPRSRAALLAGGAVLGCASFALVGPAVVFEYVTRVLPAQAAAETGYVYQYSLAYLLQAIGLPARVALALGDLSYVAMLLAGLVVGNRAARALGRPELRAYVPAACSVIAGPYVHMVDLPFAIPAAAVLATTLEGRLKKLATGALALLAVPWIAVWINKKLFLATLLAVGGILYGTCADAVASVAVFASIALAIYLLELSPPAPLTATTPGTFAPTDLAQEAWRYYVSRLGSVSPLWLAVKLPTWLALVGLLLIAYGAERGPRTPAKGS